MRPQFQLFRLGPGGFRIGRALAKAWTEVRRLAGDVVPFHGPVMLSGSSCLPARHLDTGRHGVHGTTGWVLQSAAAINNAGCIVGNGILNGSRRGFVLIPRTVGN
jgi:hypothetical protein